jgi:serine/threonine-protein kinase
MLEDVWPWLAVLALLAVAALVVWLVVLNDDGKTKRTAPDVVGLQQQVAIKRLTDAGYSVRAIREPADRPEGVVASQSPAVNDVVTIHVSSGRVATTATTTTVETTTQETTTVAAPTVAVPDVSGQDMASASGQVEASGLVAQTDPVEASGTAGSVVQQSPPAGTQAKAGSVVTLGVAVGGNRPDVDIPDVTGRSAAEARAALLDAKLTVRTAYKNGKAGVVLGQSPTGQAPAYTQVTITVGQ